MSQHDEPDLTTRVCAARLHDTRRQLYREGEITVAGLRRLDEAIGLGEADTYRLVRGIANGSAE